MPSIAQQDYLRPQGKSLNDCHLLAALSHNIQHGTIFDTIINFINGDEESVNVRPLQVTDEPKEIYYFDSFNSEISRITIEYAQTQYEGLAAIQDAAEHWDVIPAFNNADGYLSEDELGAGVIGVDGKNLAVTVTNGIITALSISNESGSGTDISWEDAQKLIGLPCQAL